MRNDLQISLTKHQEELQALPNVNSFCNEEDYQENLELSWHKRDLKENIKRLKLEIAWIDKN